MQTRLMRWGFNLFPAYRGSGARISYIAADMKTVKVRLPLNWRTRNYVGTIFGGSMYAAIDPIYMVMFIKLLGPGFIVWDKAASIRFRKPGRTTLYAEFRLDDSEVESVRQALTQQEKLDRIYTVQLVDKNNEVYAVAEKTLHFRTKNRS